VDWKVSYHTSLLYIVHCPVTLSYSIYYIPLFGYLHVNGLIQWARGGGKTPCKLSSQRQNKTQLQSADCHAHTKFARRAQQHGPTEDMGRYTERARILLTTPTARRRRTCAIQIKIQWRAPLSRRATQKQARYRVHPLSTSMTTCMDVDEDHRRNESYRLTLDPSHKCSPLR